MTLTPVLRRLDRFESQAAFRVLLGALSRPGRVLRVPVAGLGAAAVPLTLADVETTVAAPGDPALERRLVLATGAAVAGAEAADLVACPAGTDGSVVARLRRGRALAPEEGAKVGLPCRELHPDRSGQLTLTLSGPGVDGTARLGVDGLGRDVFEALAAANADPPAGVDVWLVDAADRVVGLPRTTRVEVA